MTSFTLKIITPERIILEKEAVSATLPVLGGQITILPNHMSIIGALTEGGDMIIRDISEEMHFISSVGGCLEFHNNALTILVNSAETAEEIDENDGSDETQ